MQLNDKKLKGNAPKPSIRSALIMATCTVLSGSLAPASAEEEAGTLSQIDLSTFYYSEKDRVTVNTTHVAVENDFGDEEIVRANFVYDTITGASPNGRIIPVGGSSGSIPFTSASGFSVTVNDGGSTGNKWLTEFTDKRAALDVSWEKPITRTLKRAFEGSFSSENDFSALGAAATLAWDINQRNTTLTTGMALLEETVSPASGTPAELGISNCNDSAQALPPIWANCNITSRRFGDGSKRVFDGVIGVTQVVNRRTITQLNYSHGVSLGYLTDPYKLISVVDSDLDGEEVVIIYEKRPDRRTRNSLYWKTVSQLSSEEVVDFSYRYFWDDWGIKSHTIDFKYRYDYSSRSYLQPHVRYNTQNSADFFYASLDAADELPQYASADYRLGKLQTYSIGLKYGKALGKNSKFAMRAEYIAQNYGGSTLPNMEALVYQGTFSFKF